MTNKIPKRRISNLHQEVKVSLANDINYSKDPYAEKTVSILTKAQEIIYGNREQAYGHPSKNLNLIANYWTAHLNSKYGLNINLTAEDVCGMMILLKQARLANSPEHIDSLVDLAGYAALQERILTS